MWRLNDVIRRMGKRSRDARHTRVSRSAGWRLVEFTWVQLLHCMKMYVRPLTILFPPASIIPGIYETFGRAIIPIKNY